MDIRSKEFGDSKNKKGKFAENKSKEYIEQSFLNDFIFFNPTFKSGTGEKELADLILVYFDTLIIIQCKSKKKSEDVAKYIRTTVKEACDQLKSSYNRLSNPKFNVEFNNIRRGNVNWDSSKINKIYTLIILEQDYPIASYNLAVSIYPEIKKLKFVPQIFDLEDLKNLLGLLNTPSDFFNYINEREKIITNPAYKMHNEKELFGFYLSNNRRMNIFEEYPETSLVMFDGSFSESLNEGELAEKLTQKIKLDNDSYFIDKILNEMHTTQSDDYLLVMEELVKLTRFERRVIGKAAVEKAIDVSKRESKRGWRFIIHPNNNQLGFVFVYSDLPRENAKILLQNTSFSAKYKLRLKKVIGISMPAPTIGITYFDFLYDDREYSYPDTKMENAVAKIWGKEFRTREDEFPQNHEVK
ncbi:MAG: hypothetical protein KKD75_05505 [Nanoarchaeota archaeon]|nr:hypothetical protein [Nanoarchaeota archaeon]